MDDVDKISCDVVKWRKITAESLNLDYAILLEQAAATRLQGELENSLEYFSGDLARVRVFGKWHPIPRQQAAFGDPGISYRFSGLTVPALPWPPALLALRQKLMQLTGVRFDFVLVNRYRDGNDHIGEHRDDEAELDPTAPIASISLGQKRTFVLKHRDTRKSGPGKRDIPAEKASTDGTNQREHQVLERQPKATPIGFAKFEEKKLGQSDKKTKLQKLFRKASNAKDTGAGDREYRDRAPRELVIPPSALEKQKKDFFEHFPNLDNTVERDTRKCIQVFFGNIAKHHQMKTVDELSDMTQNFYQVFAKRMDTSPNYAEVDGDTKELLLDYVEKHSMTYLHSLLFSPGSCDDEKKDAQIHTRIRQLCWVSPQHLDCRIDQGNARVRDLLYAAISELVAMDSELSPGGKLSHVVECCRGVVGVVGAAGGGPASADELLPSLIFTVLKANPPRLTSNVNFVTRFCNAARLMTGEGGYYFTNLCCAVSFIENLTAESLNMSKDDFDGYMSLPSIVGGGSWVAALSLCEGLHEVQDQIKTLQQLERRTLSIENDAKDLQEQVETFKEEILKKVADVLARTPLDIYKRHRTAAQNDTEQIIIEPLRDENQSVSIVNERTEIIPINKTQDIFDLCIEDTTAALIESTPSTVEIPCAVKLEANTSDMEHLLPPGSLANLSMALDNPPISTLKTIGSGEFLSPSPIFGFGSFDTQSLDELATPDDFGSESFLQGLTNVNYDIDLSDLSAENSAAEDVPVIIDNVKNCQQDPFSPDGLTFPNNMQGWQTMQAMSLRPADNSTKPFSSLLTTQMQNEPASTSILDANDSPTTDCLLPSPIKPLSSYQP